MLDVIRARLPEGSNKSRKIRTDSDGPEERRGSARPGFLDGAAAMIGSSKAIGSSNARIRSAPA